MTLSFRQHPLRGPARSQTTSYATFCDLIAHIEKRLKSPRIGPEAFDDGEREFLALEVIIVDVGNLELAAGGGLEGLHDRKHFVVVEIKSRLCEVRFRVLWFLLDRQNMLFALVENRDAKSRRILHLFEKNPGTPLERGHLFFEILSKNVISQDNGDRLSVGEIFRVA